MDPNGNADPVAAWMSAFDSTAVGNLAAYLGGLQQLAAMTGQLLADEPETMATAMQHLIAVRITVMDAARSALGVGADDAQDAPANAPQAPAQAPATAFNSGTIVGAPEPVDALTVDPELPAPWTLAEPPARTTDALADALTGPTAELPQAADPTAPVGGRDHPVDVDPANSTAPALVPGRDHPVDWTPEG